MTDWLKEAKAIEEDLIRLRRDIHAHPETGNKEVRTSQVLEKELNDLGIETRRMLETAVVGVLHGGRPGKTVALRTDMDALPIRECTGLPYASQNDGVMHACGHDIHMASLIGAAKLLAAHREELCGDVVFLLQPDEEENGGAERMIKEGAIDGVDAVFGAHINPALPAGTIGVKYGPFYAAATKFDLIVHGKATHGAEPENGIDALYAAGMLAVELKRLTGLYHNERAVVSVGTLHSGVARNIIPDTAEMTGIIRVPSVEMRDEMKKRFLKTVAAVASMTAVEVDADVWYGYPGIVNHDAETAHVQKTVEEMDGVSVQVLEEGTMTSEDFGYFLLERPGSFYHIGAGCEQPLHSPLITPDESSIACAAAVHAAVLFNYLNK